MVDDGVRGKSFTKIIRVPRSVLIRRGPSPTDKRHKVCLLPFSVFADPTVSNHFVAEASLVVATGLLSAVLPDSPRMYRRRHQTGYTQRAHHPEALVQYLMYQVNHRQTISMEVIAFEVGNVQCWLCFRFRNRQRTNLVSTSSCPTCSLEVWFTPSSTIS